MVSLISLLLASEANALLPLFTQGNKFYQLNEDYSKPASSFPIYGVDYQPGGSSGFSLSSSTDVLSEPAACQRDAYALQQLGANAIRVYSVSPWINHDECMTIFNDAGIYVLLDVNTPDSSLHRFNPEDSYNEGYLNNVFGLVDAFKGFPNLMGFIAGNEIINDAKSAKSDPKYIRAVIRDVKDYINRWANRTIPVGYAAADVAEYLTETWEYFQCNANDGNSTTDELSRADFFGINSYAWCSGSNDYQSSGYNNIKTTFQNSTIPVIFTEYGCNKVRPRTFEEVNEGIYGPLANVTCGSFVYEYSNEVSNYGLVDIDSDGNVSYFEDYANLQTAFSKATVATTTLSSTITGTSVLNGVPTCNSQLASSGFGWDLNLPSCPAQNLLSTGGGNNNVGRLETLNGTVSKTYQIVNAQGSTLTPDYNFNGTANNQRNAPSGSKSSETSSGSASSSGSGSSKSTSHSTKSKNVGEQLTLPLTLGGLAAFIFSLL